MRTTNPLKRQLEEARGRTPIIRIFLNETSSLRLATVLGADHSDQYAKRRDIIPDSPTHLLKAILRTAHAA